MRTLRLIRGHLDGGRSDVHTDYQALPREESLVLARQTLERLCAGSSDPQAGLPDVSPDRCDVHSRLAYGLCQECGRKTLARFRYGAFEPLPRLCPPAPERPQAPHRRRPGQL